MTKRAQEAVPPLQVQRGPTKEIWSIQASGIPNFNYRTILLGSSSLTAGVVAGTFSVGSGEAAAASGAGTLAPIALFYLAAFDYPAAGLLPAKLRVKVQLATNDVAPASDFVFGLRPVTRPASSGGAGVCIYTLGAIVTGSQCAFALPAADALLQTNSTDFVLPADGFYCLSVATNATIAASAHVHVNMQLQMHNA
jgi:hypothetical protein